jgi:hypothetical protein
MPRGRLTCLAPPEIGIIGIYVFLPAFVLQTMQWLSGNKEELLQLLSRTSFFAHRLPRLGWAGVTEKSRLHRKAFGLSLSRSTVILCKKKKTRCFGVCIIRPEQSLIIYLIAFEIGKYWGDFEGYFHQAREFAVPVPGSLINQPFLPVLFDGIDVARATAH